MNDEMLLNTLLTYADYVKHYSSKNILKNADMKKINADVNGIINNYKKGFITLDYAMNQISSIAVFGYC